MYNCVVLMSETITQDADSDGEQDCDGSEEPEPSAHAPSRGALRGGGNAARDGGRR